METVQALVQENQQLRQKVEKLENASSMHMDGMQQRIILLENKVHLLSGNTDIDLHEDTPSQGGILIMKSVPEEPTQNSAEDLPIYKRNTQTEYQNEQVVDDKSSRSESVTEMYKEPE